MTVHLGDLVGPLVDGQLDHDGRDRALSHVAQCPDCQREVATHRRLKARLLALGGPELPPGAVNRLLGLPASAFGEVGAPRGRPDTALRARPEPALGARPASTLGVGPEPAVHAAIGTTGPSAPPAVISAMNAVLASTAAQLAHFGAAAISGRAGSVFPGRSRGPFGGPPALRRDGLPSALPGRTAPALTGAVLPAAPLPADPLPAASLSVADRSAVAESATGEPAVAEPAVRELAGIVPMISVAAPAGRVPAIGIATPHVPTADRRPGSAPASVRTSPSVMGRPAGRTGSDPALDPSAVDGDRGAWRPEPGWTVRRTVLGSAAALAAVMVGGVALAGGPPSSSTRTPTTTITPVTASFAVARTAGSRTAGEVLVVPGRTGMTGSGALTTVPIVLRSEP